MYIEPIKSKDQFKRFLEKNKSLDKINLQRQKSKENKKSRTPKCSFIQCSPSIEKEKSFRINENQMYKKILQAQRSYNANIQEIKNIDIKLNEHLKQQKSKKFLLNYPKLQERLKFTYNKLPRKDLFYGIINDENNRQKSLEQNRNRSNVLNLTSPLQIWKQVSKHYKKSKASITMINSIDEKKRKISKEKLNLLINEGKTQDKEHPSIIKSEQDSKTDSIIDLLSRKMKQQIEKINEKKQNQLQQTILLRRSFSEDELQHSKVTLDCDFTADNSKEIVKSSNHTQVQSNCFGSSTAGKHHSVLLVHKQPLSSSIQTFFKPVQSVSTFQNSPVNQSIRIKKKKITQRSIQQLQKIKNKLFTQQVTKDLQKNTNGDVQTQNHPLANLSTSNSQNVSKRTSFKKIQKIDFKKIHSQLQSPKNKQIKKSIKQPLQLIKIKTPQVHHPTAIITPNLYKVTPTSSVISFSQDPNHEKHKKIEKCQSFFNAW